MFIEFYSILPKVFRVSPHFHFHSLLIFCYSFFYYHSFLSFSFYFNVFIIFHFHFLTIFFFFLLFFFEIPHFHFLPSWLGLLNTQTAYLQRGKTYPHMHTLNECPGYNNKQSDGEVPVLLELWGMWSTRSLPSFPCPL